MAWSWDGASLDVQIGFGFPPATAIASITWTTITNYVRSLSFGNGKSDVLDSYQAGRLSMVLDNRDRRFDPLHATGPYFGNLKPMVPVRVRFTYGGTTVTLWTGFVSGFPQAYDPPSDATVNVTASDGFAVLQRTKMPSLYAYEVGADTPSLWWRLGEQAGTVAVDSSGNNLDGVYSGGATFNSITGFVSDSDNAIHFQAGMMAAAAIVPPTPPLTLEAWVSYTAGAQFNQPIFQFGSAQSDYIQVGFGGSGEITATYWKGGGGALQGGTSSAITPPGYGDGQVRHLVVVFPSTTAGPRIYLDGVDLTSTSSGSGTATSLGTVPFILNSTLRADFNPPASANHDTDISLDEVAIYPTALSSGRMLVHLAAGTAPLAGLDTGAAISKVLDIIGWPAADRAIETGKSTVVAFDMGGMTALEVIQAMEKTEQGRFFLAPDGKATFYNRHHTLTTAASTTSQATFGDSGGELPYGDLGLEFGEDKIRNSITTQRANGSPFVVKDATSIDDYREREYSVTGLYNSSDGEIRDLGLWLLGHYSQPVTRVPEIVINPRAAPTTLFPQIRDRKLTDRVTVKRRPQSVGTAISLAELIEGVQHDITPDNWTVRLLQSPAETTGFFILDNATFGQLGNNRLAF